MSAAAKPALALLGGVCWCLPAHCRSGEARGGCSPVPSTPRAQQGLPPCPVGEGLPTARSAPGRLRLSRHPKQPRCCQGLTAMPVPHGAGRWQKAVSGSCCPPGELAPVPVPPSCSAGRCFWHFLPHGFFDLNSATATWSFHLDGAIECCHRSPGCHQQSLGTAMQAQHPARL